MSIETNLYGRLRNTSLPASNGMLPVYEAVSNAIHAIEDARVPPRDGRITVQIDRDRQAALAFEQAAKRPGPDAKSDIVGFTITDNGVGFNDANMQSFLTLDSEYKASRGGRGVGRLLWLKAFDRASVESVYEITGGKRSKRSFTFDAKQGVSVPTIENDVALPRSTQVRLIGFARRFREPSPKTARVIAKNLFEHCLWYFVRPGGAPTIEVIDDDETIALDDIYGEHMIAAATAESIDLKGTRFDLIHIKLSASSTRGHGIAFCAANRMVTQESLKGKIPGLFGNRNCLPRQGGRRVGWVWRRVVARNSSGSTVRWWQVRITDMRMLCAWAPFQVRLPPQTLRLTTAGRMARSAQWLVA